MTRGEYATAREQKAATDPILFHMIAMHQRKTTRIMATENNDGTKKTRERLDRA
jgi:hypothetical protein